MNAETEKVLAKVKKLLALSKSPNEAEALSAANKAQALLAEYNLSLSMVENIGEPEEFIIDQGTKTDSLPWRRAIANAVAQMYFCKYYFQYLKVPTPTRACGYIRYDIHNFAGARHNIDVAKSMFEYLNGTVDRLAKEGAGKVPTHEKSAYITSFRGACANRLYARIMERIAEAKRGGVVKTESGSNLPALANLYESTSRQLTAFINKEVGGLRSHKRTTSLNHGQGAMDGRDAGNRIGLDKQVGRSSAGHLLN